VINSLLLISWRDRSFVRISQRRHARPQELSKQQQARERRASAPRLTSNHQGLFASLGGVQEGDAANKRMHVRPPRQMTEAQHRKEVPNEHIFRFVCFESVACDSHADPRSRNGRWAVAVAEDVPARAVSARATLYARSGSEMAGEARTLQRALDLGRVLAAIERQEVASQLLHLPVISTSASNVDPSSTAADF